MRLPRLGLAAFWLFLPLLASSGEPAVTALKAARLLNVVDGSIRQDAVVLIKEGHILQAGSQLPIPADATVLELGDVTLMPGLVDVHTHLLQSFSPTYSEDRNLLLAVAELNTAQRALSAVPTAREYLQAGFTTVRDMGNAGVLGDVALRNAVARGHVEGPRMLVSTRALSAVGGQFGALSVLGQKLIDGEYSVVTGAVECRRAVRQAVADGADVIKVIVDSPPVSLGAEELAALVDEAHRGGRKVAAHAVMDAAIRMAAEAGADSVEHGYDAGDETLKVLAHKGTFLVPTDYPPDFYVTVLANLPGIPEAKRQLAAEHMRAFGVANQQRLARAMKAKVRIAFGSDAYYSLPGMTRGEEALSALKNYGASMTPLQALQAATVNAAALLGQHKRMGTLAPGLDADLIAVAGDPLQDLSALDHVRMVMKAGRVVKHAAP